MRRRRVISSVGLGLLGGCSTPSANSEIPSDSTSEVTTSKPTSDGNNGNCNSSQIIRPSPKETSDIGPYKYPDKPDSLTPDSVKSYFKSFEVSYSSNALLEETSASSINVEIRDTSITSVDEGFLAHLKVQVMYTVSNDQTPTSTGDKKHTANYFVNSGLIYRAETDSIENTDPRNHSSKVLVECSE